MDLHIKSFFSQFSEESPEGRFYRVIDLCEAPDLEWEKELSCDVASKGWFYLATLPTEARLEFVREFWILKMEHHPAFIRFFLDCFNALDDIRIFLTQKTPSSPMQCYMVYSRARNGGFFYGALPATEEQISALEQEFIDHVFPEDYLSFMQVHNGFWKATDSTGVIPVDEVRKTYKELQSLIESSGCTPKTYLGRVVDPTQLIPFYKSFGLPSFQCFWSEWHPQEEMGNVFWSLENPPLPDEKGRKSKEEWMAFASFVGWLKFYLEKIEQSL